MLKSLEYRQLIFVAVILGLAPYYPMPHLVEKLIMLSNGTLKRPIDIFDLIMHGAPVVLLIVKFVSDIVEKMKGASA